VIRSIATYAATVALAFSPASAAAKPAAKAALVRDWSKAVVATPEGGFRMGNPAARVKLIEYGSLACPHCRHCAKTGYQPLVQKYVRTGRVSYEFRNLLINGPDLAASLLARCRGASGFFPLADAMFAAQPQWQKKIIEMSDADKASLEAMSDQERIVRFAAIGGLTTIAGRFAIAPSRAQQCLADRAATTRLIDMTQAAMDKGVNGTPTFLINGKPSGVASWEELEPLLRKALGRG
jgi:protein-disulfide isomerase